MKYLWPFIIFIFVFYVSSSIGEKMISFIQSNLSIILSSLCSAFGGTFLGGVALYRFQIYQDNKKELQKYLQAKEEAPDLFEMFINELSKDKKYRCLEVKAIQDNDKLSLQLDHLISLGYIIGKIGQEMLPSITVRDKTLYYRLTRQFALQIIKQEKIK